MKDERSDELIEIRDFDEIRLLLGPLDSNTRLIRDLHGVNVLVRDGSMRLMGPSQSVTKVAETLGEVLDRVRRGDKVATSDVTEMLRGGPSPRESGAPAPPSSEHRMPRRSGPVQPRTPGQREYWEAMHSHDVVFGVGPAGTGKTYLAVAAAIGAVRSGQCRRIVLVRPAVEAGEKLGFLPGDFQAKVDPYLRPLYDAIHDLLEPGARARYLESDIVEVCPLAYMRGRTMNDAFVILDEAQNCTVPQMLMFLTRMGEGSRVVVTGDPSQVDLPPNTRSGLSDALERLEGVDGVGSIRLKTRDIVRHPVVQRIIEAYRDSERSF